MTAALMGAIAVVSIVLPGAVVFAWLGAVPMGVLCYRHRIRVALAACVAAGLISFLIAGFGGLVSALTCAYMGAISGQVRRRSRGAATMFTVAALWGVLVSTFCVGVFAALRNLREVVLGAVAANVGGSRRCCREFRFSDGVRRAWTMPSPAGLCIGRGSLESRCG
ncbi:Putative ABC transporter%2C ATP-binding protein [Mycobacteroides abscessus]|nr:Putative ABC transporter%2C ATP-binding protein [Mycobacteroides abscessus]